MGFSLPSRRCATAPSSSPRSSSKRASVPIVLLSKKTAVPIDHVVHVLGAPVALAGFMVAALILAPESLAAVRAALANQLQRAINLLLGSVLASISLTIPAVLAIGLLTDRTVVL